MNNRYKSLSLTIGASALVIFLLCAWLVGSHAPALNANDAALRSLVNAHRTNWGTAFFTHLTLAYNSTGTTIITGFVTLVALLGFSWRAGLQVALTVLPLGPRGPERPDDGVLSPVNLADQVAD